MVKQSTDFSNISNNCVVPPLCLMFKIKGMSMKIFIGIIFCLYSSYIFASPTTKSYELPNHGALLINVPQEWKDQVRYPPGKLPPTITWS